MPALQMHAGPRALAHLREHGLRPRDVRMVPAAAGGPKGLALNPLDRFLFGTWLADAAQAPQTIHLVGASIGAWRMAAACKNNPTAALEELADDYITQDYEHAPGKPPSPRHVSDVFGARLALRFSGADAAQVLAHPRFRLHVVTSRGRHLLRREHRVATPLGYFGAFATNALSRRAMGAWLERVLFSDPREALPIVLNDYRTRSVPLSAHNLAPSILASCSIPFWLEAVHDIPGGPRGAYWDGGITDYHLHWPYHQLHADDDGANLVLYPHFQSRVVPGWLDKALKHRHRASRFLDNLVLASPTREWIATLPNAKLPDRGDFKAYGDDLAGRVKAWRRAVAESERLADEFAQLVRQPSLHAQPLE
jgi:hypothetical protein